MKGPGLRIDLDVRRLWQCPRCGRQLRLSGDVVSRVCHCQKEGTTMQLIEEVRKAAHPSACDEIRPADGAELPSAQEDQRANAEPETDLRTSVIPQSSAEETPGRLPESDSAIPD